MRFVFWNCCTKAPDDAIVELADQLDVELIALCEYIGDAEALTDRLGRINAHYPTNRGMEKGPLRLYCRREFFAAGRNVLDATDGMELLNTERKRYSPVRLQPRHAEQLLLAVAHLPSRLHDENNQRIRTARHFGSDIRARYKEFGGRVVVMGDLNMEPWEPGMTHVDALNAVQTKSEASKTRTFDDIDYETLFNPMWRFVCPRTTDDVELVGTYKFSGRGAEQALW